MDVCPCLWIFPILLYDIGILSEILMVNDELVHVGTEITIPNIWQTTLYVLRLHQVELDFLCSVYEETQHREH